MNFTIPIILTMLGVMSVAIHSLTKKENIEEAMKKLIGDNSEQSLLTQLGPVTLAANLCFSAGVLLTLNYAITYFSGSDLRNINHWGLTQWGGAAIGAIVTISITLAQKALYSNISNHEIAKLVTLIILSFVIFSEVSSPMEKEDLKMRERSAESLVFQTAIKSVNTNKEQSTRNPYAQKIAEAQAKLNQHQLELNRCGRYHSNKRQEKCRVYESKKITAQQGVINSYQSSSSDSIKASQQLTLGMLEKAKELETNNNNHSPIIKLMKETINGSFIQAMAVTSLWLIIAFEAAFHFVASYQAMLITALTKKGNLDVSYKIKAKQLKNAQKYAQMQKRYDDLGEFAKTSTQKAKETVKETITGKGQAPATNLVPPQPTAPTPTPTLSNSKIAPPSKQEQKKKIAKITIDKSFLNVISRPDYIDIAVAIMTGEINPSQPQLKKKAGKQGLGGSTAEVMLRTFEIMGIISGKAQNGQRKTIVKLDNQAAHNLANQFIEIVKQGANNAS